MPFLTFAPDFMDFTGWTTVGTGAHKTVVMDGAAHIIYNFPAAYSPNTELAGEVGLATDVLGTLDGGSMEFKLVLPASIYSGIHPPYATIAFGMFSPAQDFDDESPSEGFYGDNLGSWSGYVHAAPSGLFFYTHNLARPYYRFVSDGTDTVFYDSPEGVVYTLVHTFTGNSGSDSQFRILVDLHINILQTYHAINFEVLLDDLTIVYFVNTTEVTKTVTARWDVTRYDIVGAFVAQHTRFFPVAS